MLAVRLALLATSIAVCAWFALGAVQVHDQAGATALLGVRGIPPKSRTTEILRLLDRAGTLNPDRRIDILRAQANIVADERGLAEREMDAVVRDEPKNIDAWLVLSIAADPRDPAAERRATAKVRELAPPVPRAP